MGEGKVAMSRRDFTSLLPVLDAWRNAPSPSPFPPPNLAGVNRLDQPQFFFPIDVVQPLKRKPRGSNSCKLPPTFQSGFFEESNTENNAGVNLHYISLLQVICVAAVNISITENFLSYISCSCSRFLCGCYFWGVAFLTFDIKHHILPRSLHPQVSFGCTLVLLNQCFASSNVRSISIVLIVPSPTPLTLLFIVFVYFNYLPFLIHYPVHIQPFLTCTLYW